jgi:hypothetical protein
MPGAAVCTRLANRVTHLSGGGAINTVQLTLLWYGGLAVIAVLLLTAMDHGALYFLAAIVTLTALAVFTFSSSIRASRSRVAIFVAGPVVLVPLLWWGWEAYSARRASSLVKPGEVSITDEALHTDNIGGFTYSAKVRNRSKYELAEVTLEFVVKDSGDVIERTTQSIYLQVPPGEVRTFDKKRVQMQDATVARLFNEGRNKGMTLDIQVVGTKTAR